MGRDCHVFLLPNNQPPFQSTRPVWGATHDCFADSGRAIISIHAPRMGRDKRTRQAFSDKLDISIHAPRMGRDVNNDLRVGTSPLFQSTRPVWGATGGRSAFRGAHSISIHAPRMGRDITTIVEAIPQIIISIHAPRMGRDLLRHSFPVNGIRYFNPRAPYGARPRS